MPDEENERKKNPGGSCIGEFLEKDFPQSLNSVVRKLDAF